MSASTLSRRRNGAGTSRPHRSWTPAELACRSRQLETWLQQYLMTHGILKNADAARMTREIILHIHKALSEIMDGPGAGKQ